MNKYPIKNPICFGDDIPLCPHCGKHMVKLTRGKLVRDIWHEGDEDSWGYNSRETVPTYKCQDCGIKYTTYYDTEYKYEWVFPKNYQQTVTDKQLSYINYLYHKIFLNYCRTADRDNIEFPYITSLELASKWISEYKPLVDKQEADDKLRTSIMNQLDEIGIREYNASGRYHCVKTTALSFRDLSVFKTSDKFQFQPLIIIDWNNYTVSAEYSITATVEQPMVTLDMSYNLNELNNLTETVRNIINKVYEENVRG